MQSRLGKLFFYGLANERKAHMSCQTNDTVLYGTEGVCRVVGVEEREMCGGRCEYYILQPVHTAHSTIFVPVDNETLARRIRPVLTPKEIYALIEAMPDESSIWIEDETARRTQYKQILLEGDRANLVRIVKTLYGYQQAQKEKGRKMHVADERLLKDAEKLLHDEFTYVLHLRHDEVLPLILKQIPAKKQ